MAEVGKRSNDDAELDFTKTKKPRSLRKSHRPTHLEDIPDSEEDPGHSASLKFLATAKETKMRSNAVVANHTHAVEAQMQSLSSTLDDKALKIKMRDAQLQAFLVNILADSRRGVPEKDAERPKEPEKEKFAGHAIYQSGLSAIVSSRVLLAQYDKVCEQIASREGALKKGAGQEGDCEALRRVLQRQGEKVKLELSQFLDGDNQDSTELPPDDTSVGDNDLWSRYAVTSKQEKGSAGVAEGQGWAMVAKHAQRAVHHMVKDLPEKGE